MARLRAARLSELVGEREGRGVGRVLVGVFELVAASVAGGAVEVAVAVAGGAD
jgi:hypothetical protein